MNVLNVGKPFNFKKGIFLVFLGTSIHRIVEAMNRGLKRDAMFSTVQNIDSCVEP